MRNQRRFFPMLSRGRWGSYCCTGGNSTTVWRELPQLNRLVRFVSALINDTGKAILPGFALLYKAIIVV